MLHQIRKMVGLIVLMMRCNVDAALVAKLYGEVRVNVPKMPSLGLFLDATVYDGYNKSAQQMAER